MAQPLQLETTIGFSGKISWGELHILSIHLSILLPQFPPPSFLNHIGRVSGGLVVHPNKEQLVYPLGCALVQEKIAGKKSQQFLVGDNNNIACVAVSRSGKYVATGLCTHQGYQVR